jgi:hypothetical protein
MDCVTTVTVRLELVEGLPDQVALEGELLGIGQVFEFKAADLGCVGVLRFNAVGTRLSQPVNFGPEKVGVSLGYLSYDDFTGQGIGNETDFTLVVANAFTVNTEAFDRQWKPLANFNGHVTWL